MQVGVTILVVFTTLTDGLPLVTVARTLVVVLVTRLGVIVLVRTTVVEASYTVDAGRVTFSTISMIVAVKVSILVTRSVR
jgi:hypothetical protein